MQDKPTVLLADADVLIDYRDSDLAILGLVARHLGRVAVLLPILDEVRNFTEPEAGQLGIEVVEVETDWLLHAAKEESRISFNDRLCLVVCRSEGWTCVTNDRALRRLCTRHGVKTRFGLALMADLVANCALTRRRAVDVARQIQASNPFHITDRIINRFISTIEKL